MGTDLDGFFGSAWRCSGGIIVIGGINLVSVSGGGDDCLGRCRGLTVREDILLICEEESRNFSDILVSGASLIKFVMYGNPGGRAIFDVSTKIACTS